MSDNTDDIEVTDFSHIDSIVKRLKIQYTGFVLLAVTVCLVSIPAAFLISWFEYLDFGLFIVFLITALFLQISLKSTEKKLIVARSKAAKELALVQSRLATINKEILAKENYHQEQY